MNTVILSGNICSELKDNLRFTRGGKKFLDFTLAVRRTKDTTTFIRCRAWEGTCDLLLSYCGKGDKITVQGRLEVSEYKDGEDQKYYTYVSITEISFGFKPSGKGATA